MKNRIYYLFVLTLLCAIPDTSLFAQAPQGIPYQAIASNSSGVVLVSTTITVRFSIRDNTLGGAILYREVFAPTTSTQGAFAVNIGTGTPDIGTFSNINWGVNAKFLQVEMDPAGGTSYTNMGTTQLMSVPYALYANNGNPVGTAAGAMLYWNGTTWVNVTPGITGQTLTYCGGVPTWGPCAGSVSTSPITFITSSSAISGGTITATGAIVTARGVCWSTSTGPTVALSTKTTDGSGTGNFTSNLTGLAASTTYYVRAYATYSSGTDYGTEISFTTSSTTPSPVIGASYGGGIIAYILQPGDPGYDALVPHGLIAAPSDLPSTGIPWGCYGTLLGTSAVIGSGAMNTIVVSGACGTGTAARQCNDLVIGLYGDWYLPSKAELNKLFINRAVITGITVDYYWCSTEQDNYHAFTQNFFNGFYGDSSDSDKAHGHRVRPVRSF